MKGSVSGGGPIAPLISQKLSNAATSVKRPSIDRLTNYNFYGSHFDVRSILRSAEVIKCKKAATVKYKTKNYTHGASADIF